MPESSIIAARNRLNSDAQLVYSTKMSCLPV